MTDFIAVYDNALPAELCASITQRFEQSTAHAGATGSGVRPAVKDSSDINITQAHDWRDLHRAVVDITFEHLLRYTLTFPHMLTGAIAAGRLDRHGTPVDLQADEVDEPMASVLTNRLYRPGDIIAQRYAAGTGGYHHWHSEIYPQGPDSETLHRVLLFMFYVNSVAQGGDTEFFYQQRRIRPEAGRMVIAPAGFTHTHKGHVPLSEDKLILTSWVLFNRAEAIYGGDA